MEMIGGFMKTSRFALAAAAGLLLGAAMTPAKAADLGGGCCADLEERVAELEATTARKGNRVVSLQVYGQVNKGLLVWDDGVDSDAFIVDGAYSSSRFGFIGKAKIKPGWTAGYNMEFEVVDSRSDQITNLNKAGDDPEGTASTLSMRQNYLYVESERLGRLSIGHQSTAADGGTEVVLGNSMRNSDIHYGNALKIRAGNGYVVDGSGNTVTLGSLAGNLDAGRDDVVRYDSPSIYGFILSASWGDNDYADVVLRFKKEFANIRLVAGIGYVWAQVTPTGTSAGNFEEVAGSISAMHVPTGLYVAFAAANRSYEDPTRADSSMWYVQGGIEKKLLPYGSTTVYGEYGKYSDITYRGAETTRWGLGVNQKIDSAAMDIYAQATFYSFDGVVAVDPAGRAFSAEDMSTLMIGSRIQF
jgi:hypothetical protein